MTNYMRAVYVLNYPLSVAFCVFPLLWNVFGACFQLLVYKYTVTSSYSASRFLLCCQVVASCQASRSVNSRGAAALMLWISLWLLQPQAWDWGWGACLSSHSNQVDAIVKQMVITGNMREREVRRGSLGTILTATVLYCISIYFFNNGSLISYRCR